MSGESCWWSDGRSADGDVELVEAAQRESVSPGGFGVEEGPDVFVWQGPSSNISQRVKGGTDGVVTLIGFCVEGQQSSLQR